MPDGNILVSFLYNRDMYAQVIAPDGTILSDPILLNLHGTDALNSSSIAVLPNGNFSFVYIADYGSSSVVVSRVFSIDVNPDGITLTNVDDVFIANGIEGTLIEALEGDDDITGTIDDDRIFGDAGHDTLRGLDGIDALYGGAGHDVLFGGDGQDILEGNDGNDTVNGGAGEDHLDGNTGDDIVYGGAGNDLIFSSLGQDTYFGDAGDDLFTVKRERDDDLENRQTLYGGDGDDYFRMILGTNNAMFGGAGDDVFDVSGVKKSEFVLYKAGGRIDGGAGTDVMVLRQGAVVNLQTGTWQFSRLPDEPTYSVENIEVFYFSTSGTFIGAGSASGTFIGAGADDDVSYDGVRFIGNGGAGDDIFVARNNDYVNPSTINPSKATIDGGQGDDIILGGTSRDTFYGGDGNDIVSGGGFVDSLYGGGGNDTLYGGDQIDYLFGGSGDDLIDGGAENDLLILSGELDDYNIVADGEGFIITGADGTDRIENVEYVRFSDRMKASIGPDGFVVVDTLPINEFPYVVIPLQDRSSPEDEPLVIVLPAGTFVDDDGNLSLHARLKD